MFETTETVMVDSRRFARTITPSINPSFRERIDPLSAALSDAQDIPDTRNKNTIRSVFTPMSR